MVSALDIILQGRRRAGQIDADTAARMLRAYEHAMDATERHLARFRFYIDDAIASGEPIEIRWLQRQAWYRQLEASIASEMSRFAVEAGATLTQSQVAALAAASGTSSSWVATIAGGTFRGRINAPAFERWVTAAMPGSPVRGVIDRYGDRVSESILRHMTEGMGTGAGSETIIRNIMRDVGADAVEPRIRTLSRSETMRAFRGGAADTFASLERENVIVGYTWHAELSFRTCPVCVGLHGTFTPTYPQGFHPACRCVGRPVVNPRYVPGGRPRQTGDEWFAKQSPDFQRGFLLDKAGQAHWDAYQSGVPLSEMIGVKPNPIWGPMNVLKPSYAIPGGR